VSEARHDTMDAVRSVVRDVLARESSWTALAEAGLLDVGDELGLTEIAAALHELGAAAATHLPYLETAVSALVVAKCGTHSQQGRLMPAVAAGELRLAPALREPGGTATARLVAGRVSGRRTGVAEADWFLVPALDGDGEVLLLVSAQAEGVALTATESSRGVAEQTVGLTDVAAEVVGDAAAAELLRSHVTAAQVALASGLVDGARDLTARYLQERVQFGRKLAEFQAVAQQIADVFITSRTLGLAADNAVWRVDSGLPAADDLAVAAYWAASQAPAALATCHHLHGGMGLDITYPLPSYSAWISDLAAALGGTEASLEAVAIEDLAAAHLELTEAQRALKAELRNYFAGLITPAEHREMMTDRHGPTYRDVVRRLGKDGWMGVGWPTEYGGKGFGDIEQTIFANEAIRAEVPLPSVTLQTVGPTLQTYGSEPQLERFLPDILAGEVHFAIGYSEPDAGTDLASLRCNARRDGDHYIVNGQKIFTTGGHAADYIWLAVRTDPDAPKHKGISILIVDTRHPGFSWTPIITADGAHHVNATYYNDVRVPVEMMVGQENDGWRLITTQLNHERVMLGPAGRLEGLRDRVAAWATAAGVADRSDVRRILGEVTAAFRVNELLNWEVARAAERGEMSVADASASKVFASEQAQRLGRLLLEVVRRYGDPAEPATAELLHLLDALGKRNLVLTFGGGVNEVQRELIAQFGLRLPRVPR
jgi:alkylation response protein AidB-like acyl-CoA dehydrogenase